MSNAEKSKSGIRGLALDVGITTGIVCAGLRQDEIPFIFKHAAIHLDKLLSLETKVMTEALAGMDWAVIIVEWPHLNTISSHQTKTRHALDFWQGWLNRYEAKHPNTTILSVRPTEWMSSSAKNINVFGRQPHGIKFPLVTKHEREAAQMLYWLTTRGHRKHNIKFSP